MKYTISAEWKLISTDSITEIGGAGYCNYIVGLDLTIDGHTKSVEIEGWVVCGFLAPGANQDLNGSGLSQWGSSQPGGWSVCDSDSQQSGLPRADENSQGESVTILAGDNFSGEVIDLEEFPSVVEALGKILAEPPSAECEDEEDIAIERAERREQFFSTLIAECVDAIGECDVDPDIEAPEAKNVFDDLPPLELSRNEEIDHLRIGDYRGCGLCLAWETEPGQYDYTYWPNDDEIWSAIEQTRESREDEIADALIGERKRAEGEDE
jgi:hypothetical protein